MANELRDKLVELFAITSLEFEDAVVLANYLVCNGVTIPVRCKDCKKQDTCLCPLYHCVSPQIYERDDDFCSYGERKTDG